MKDFNSVMQWIKRNRLQIPKRVLLELLLRTKAHTGTRKVPFGIRFQLEALHAVVDPSFRVETSPTMNEYLGV
jgi:hypothetical protein